MKSFGGEWEEPKLFMHNYKYATLLGGGINTKTKQLGACWVADCSDLQVTT